MRALRRLLPTLLATTLLAAACGGSEGDPPGPLRLVQAPAVAKLQKLPAAVAADVPLAPRGGRAAIQVAFAARSGVTVRAEPLVLRNAAGGALAPATVLLLDDVHVSHASDAVRGGLTGSVPDPLMPLPAKAGHLRFQSLYVEVPVARTASAGRYTGDLVVHAGTVSGTTQVAVDVAAVELPAQRTLRTWFLVWDDRAEEMEKAPVRSAYHDLLRTEGIGDGTADVGRPRRRHRRPVPQAQCRAAGRGRRPRAAAEAARRHPLLLRVRRAPGRSGPGGRRRLG